VTKIIKILYLLQVEGFFLGPGLVPFLGRLLGVEVVFLLGALFRAITIHF
jgi:hypothetical protein